MNNIVIIYVTLSLFAIVTLIVLLIRCERKNPKSKSDFCMCDGIGNLDRNCRSPAESRKLYAEGNTEYSVFSKNPNYEHRPSWM